MLGVHQGVAQSQSTANVQLVKWRETMKSLCVSGDASALERHLKTINLMDVVDDVSNSCIRLAAANERYSLVELILNELIHRYVPLKHIQNAVLAALCEAMVCHKVELVFILVDRAFFLGIDKHQMVNKILYLVDRYACLDDMASIKVVLKKYQPLLVELQFASHVFQSGIFYAAVQQHMDVLRFLLERFQSLMADSKLKLHINLNQWSEILARVVKLKDPAIYRVILGFCKSNGFKFSELESGLKRAMLYLVETNNHSLLKYSFFSASKLGARFMGLDNDIGLILFEAIDKIAGEDCEQIFDLLVDQAVYFKMPMREFVMACMQRCSKAIENGEREIQCFLETEIMSAIDRNSRFGKLDLFCAGDLLVKASQYGLMDPFLHLKQYIVNGKKFDKDCKVEYLQEAISVAAEAGHGEIIWEIIDNSGNIKFMDLLGYVSDEGFLEGLCNATRNGHYDLVFQLVDCFDEFDVDYSSYESALKSALGISLSNGSRKMMEYFTDLIESSSGLDFSDLLEELDYSIFDAMEKSAKENSFAFTKYLYDLVITHDLDAFYLNQTIGPVMLSFAKHGNRSALGFFLNRYSSKDQFCCLTRFTLEALSGACEKCDLEVVYYLIDKALNSNVPWSSLIGTMDGSSGLLKLLGKACSAGNELAFDYCLDILKSSNITWSQLSGTYSKFVVNAASNQHVSLVTRLLNYAQSMGASEAAFKDLLGTSIRYSGRTAKVKYVGELFNRLTSVKSCTDLDRTLIIFQALDEAIDHHQHDMRRSLFDRLQLSKTTFEYVREFFKSSLATAAKVGCFEVISLLLNWARSRGITQFKQLCDEFNAAISQSYKSIARRKMLNYLLDRAMLMGATVADLKQITFSALTSVCRYCDDNVALFVYLDVLESRGVTWSMMKEAVCHCIELTCGLEKTSSALILVQRAYMRNAAFKDISSGILWAMEFAYEEDWFGLNSTALDFMMLVILSLEMGATIDALGYRFSSLVRVAGYTPFHETFIRLLGSLSKQKAAIGHLSDALSGAVRMALCYLDYELAKQYLEAAIALGLKLQKIDKELTTRILALVRSIPKGKEQNIFIQNLSAVGVKVVLK